MSVDRSLSDRDLLMEPQNERRIAYAEDNAAYADFNALQIRLVTDKYLQQIKETLSGKRERWVEIHDTFGNKQIKKIEEQYRTPQVNDLGLSEIIAFCESLINPMTVQGFFGSEESFDLWVREVERPLLKTFFVSYPKWGISSPTEATYVYSWLRFMINRFFSRSINDRERGSYAHTFKTSENVIQQKKGLFS